MFEALFENEVQVRIERWELNFDLDLAEMSLVGWQILDYD